MFIIRKVRRVNHSFSNSHLKSSLNRYDLVEIVQGILYKLTSQTLHSIEENSLHHLTFFLSMLRIAFLQTSFSSDIVPASILAQ